MTRAVQVRSPIGRVRYVAASGVSRGTTPRREVVTAVPQPLIAFSSDTPVLNAWQPQHEQSLGEQLFDARATLKMTVAAYVMHLERNERDRIFEEFDYLLDESGWDEEDS